MQAVTELHGMANSIVRRLNHQVPAIVDAINDVDPDVYAPPQVDRATGLMAAADADGDGRLSRHEHMAHAAREAHTRSGDGSSGCAATDTVAEGSARVLERQFPFLRAARQLQDPTRCDAQV